MGIDFLICKMIMFPGVSTKDDGALERTCG